MLQIAWKTGTAKNKRRDTTKKTKTMPYPFVTRATIHLMISLFCLLASLCQYLRMCVCLCAMAVSGQGHAGWIIWCAAIFAGWFRVAPWDFEFLALTRRAAHPYSMISCIEASKGEHVQINSFTISWVPGAKSVPFAKDMRIEFFRAVARRWFGTLLPCQNPSKEDFRSMICLQETGKRFKMQSTHTTIFM